MRSTQSTGPPVSLAKAERAVGEAPHRDHVAVQARRRGAVQLQFPQADSGGAPPTGREIEK